MENKLKTGVYTYNGKEMSFNFKTTLRAYDKMRFVNSVTDLVVDDNYNSVVRDLLFDFMIIRIFTDVDISEIREADNSINMIEELVYGTEIVNIVKENVDNELIDNLNKSVDDNIQYRTGVHRNVLEESLTGLLRTVERKVKNIDLESMMEMAEVFNSVSGEFTPEKIIDAYANTDTFKNRYNQMAGKQIG